jgi:hypothetical protein
VEEYDPVFVEDSNKMPANLNRVSVFQPLEIANTTPVSLMIVFAIITAALIP